MRRNPGPAGINFSLAQQAAGNWWTWATAAARHAQPVTDADIGKTGYQTDMRKRYWLHSQSGGAGVWLPRPWEDVGPIAQAVPRFGDAANGDALGSLGSVVTGTVTAVTPGTTRSTARARVRTLTAAGAGSIGVIRGSTAFRFPYQGGARFRMACVLGAVVSDIRWYLGFARTVPVADVDPNTLLNCTGIGRGSADTNVNVHHNDGSGTATKVALSASFPAATADIGYEFEGITVDGTSWVVETTHMNTRASVSNTLSTDLIAASDIWPILYVSNAGTGSAVSIDLAGWQFAQLLYV